MNKKICKICLKEKSLQDFRMVNKKYILNICRQCENEKALKQELIDINNRLSALETAQTSVVSESEVTE